MVLTQFVGSIPTEEDEFFHLHFLSSGNVAKRGGEKRH